MKKVISIFISLAFISMNGNPLHQETANQKRFRMIEDLVVTKNWSQALKSLDLIKTNCTDAACFSWESFTRAYVYHNMVSSDFGPELNKVDSAEKYYKKAVSDNFDYNAAYINLAALYQSLNRKEDALFTLKNLYLRDRKAANAIYLGNTFFNLNLFDSSYYYYRKAIELDPINEKGYERLSKVLALKGIPFPQIVGHCQKMNDYGFIHLSIKTISDYLINTYKNEPANSESALVWLVSLLGKSIQDSVFVSALPGSWNHRGFIELKQVLKSSEYLNNLNWWNYGENLVPGGPLIKRSIAMSRLLNARGNQLLVEGKLDDALIYLIKAFELVEHVTYNPEDVPDEYYIAAADLGIFYVKYPQLDPNGALFEKLEDQIFAGKLQAYLKGSGDAIGKFHSTLGMVYAQKNQWRSDNPYRNGIFQLEKAIEKIPDESSKGHLRYLLSEGYQSIGQVAKARPLLIQASIDFLNDDNLTYSKKCLDKYLEMAKEPDRTYRSIVALYGMRVQLENLSPFAAGNVSGLVSWTNRVNDVTPISNVISPATSHNQRFKMFSKIGLLYSDEENTLTSAYYYGLALKEVKQEKGLINYADYLRLVDAHRSITGNLNYSTEIRSPSIIYGAITEFSFDQSWPIKVPNFNESTFVGIDNGIMSGALVATVLYSGDFNLDRNFTVDIGDNEIIVNGNDTDLKKKFISTLEREREKMGLKVKIR